MIHCIYVPYKRIENKVESKSSGHTSFGHRHRYASMSCRDNGRDRQEIIQRTFRTGSYPPATFHSIKDGQLQYSSRVGLRGLSLPCAIAMSENKTHKARQFLVNSSSIVRRGCDVLWNTRSGNRIEFGIAHLNAGMRLREIISKRLLFKCTSRLEVEITRRLSC